MADVLKPCPFCGSSHLVHFVPNPDPAWNYGGRVRCDNCGAEGVTCYGDEGPAEQLIIANEKMATEHWNERH